MERGRASLFYALNNLSWFVCLAAFHAALLLEASRPSFALASVALGLSAVFFLFVGMILRPTLKRSIVYILAGSFISALSPWIVNAPPLLLASLYFLTGLVGTLFLSHSISNFLEYTSFEDRGIKSGFFLAFCSICIILVSVAFRWHLITALVLALYRLSSLVAVKAVEYAPLGAWSQEAVAHSQRGLFIFIICWLLFLVSDIFVYSSIPIYEPSGVFKQQHLLSVAVSAFSVVVGGTLMDRMGRKLPIILACSTLGILYTLLIFLPQSAVPAILVASEVPWGFLFVFYMLILPGDLLSGRAKETVICFFLSTYWIKLMLRFTELTVGWIGLSEIGPLTELLGSFLLFVSVPLLLISPETLPLRIVEKRKMTKYIEWAKRKAS